MLLVETAWTGSQDLIYVTGGNNASLGRNLNTIQVYDDRDPTDKVRGTLQWIMKGAK